MGCIYLKGVDKSSLYHRLIPPLLALSMTRAVFLLNDSSSDIFLKNYTSNNDITFPNPYLLDTVFTGEALRISPRI